MTKVWCLCGVFLSAFLQVAWAKAPPVDEIFAKADQHFLQVDYMSFRVERQMERGLQKQVERWSVTMKQPDAFRIDVEGPPQRILISRGDFYSEYIPEAKKALEMNISKLPDDKKKEFFGAILPRVAIPGFRLAISEDLKKALSFQVVAEEEALGRPCFYIEGKESRKTVGENQGKGEPGSLRIWIDRDRFTLVRMEVYEGSNFVNSIENRSFVEFKGGYWLPDQVRLKRKGPEALETVQYHLTRLMVNPPPDLLSFEPKYEKGVKVHHGSES